MSNFLNLTPAVQVVLENPFLSKTYPDEGSAVAIIDTGYEGFLAVPGSIFRELNLNGPEREKRKIALADGSLSDATGSYATVRIPYLSSEIDGFVETFRGLDEIILGVEALAELRVVLDYCVKRIRIEKCL